VLLATSREIPIRGQYDQIAHEGFVQTGKAYNASSSMPDKTDLENYYGTLTDEQLLQLRSDGGFTADAERALRIELAHRHLGSSDVNKYVAATERSKLSDEVVERGGGYRSLGFQFFGKSFLNESDRSANIEVRTKWFTVSGIPVIPIASYRFKCAKEPGRLFSTNTQRNVVSRIPLCWRQVFLTFAKTAAAIFGVGLLIVGFAEWWIRLRPHR
jgi:hypothetical protein